MSAQPLFVKVCGLTRLQDADLAADLGASAIGFIFWPGSPRFIPPDEARRIVRRKSAGVKAVGVFVDEPLDRIRQVAEVVGLDVVQLHGRESATIVRQCSAELKLSVIKTIAPGGNGAPDVSDLDADVLILLDAHDPVRHGGTGRTIDWEIARQVAASRRTILSGGLTAENVASAIAEVQPYGVDVSSGVESAPGIKDAVRMKSFFEALNG